MQNSCELRLVIGKMKRLLAICVCFFMCVGLCSCDSSQTRSVSSYNWSLEFITDLDGNMLFSGSVHDDIPVLDLTLSFEEKSFILTDNTHKQEWTGTYSLEKIDNSSSKLGLTFENLEEPVTGVYGTRVYSDDSESATITLQTDENILSFTSGTRTFNSSIISLLSWRFVTPSAGQGFLHTGSAFARANALISPSKTYIRGLMSVTPVFSRCVTGEKVCMRPS